MINLLPPEKKRELFQEVQWKSVLILGIISLVFLVSFSLILYSIKYFIIGEVEVQRFLLEEREKEFNRDETQTLQDNLISFNNTLFGLENFYKANISFTKNLEKISETLPYKVYLIDLSIIPSSDGGSNVRLYGFSPTREKLLNLKENLEMEEYFEEVYFSPTSWVKPTDINFNVNFKIK